MDTEIIKADLGIKDLNYGASTGTSQGWIRTSRPGADLLFTH
jgi:hypothetical protein